MNKELEKAINYLKLIRKNHDLEKKGYVYTEEAIETVLEALNNSVSKASLQELAQKMRKNGLITWAKEVEKLIKEGEIWKKK